MSRARCASASAADIIRLQVLSKFAVKVSSILLLLVCLQCNASADGSPGDELRRSLFAAGLAPANGQFIALDFVDAEELFADILPARDFDIDRLDAATRIEREIAFLVANLAVFRPGDFAVLKKQSFLANGYGPKIAHVLFPSQFPIALQLLGLARRFPTALRFFGVRWLLVVSGLLVVGGLVRIHRLIGFEPDSRADRD